MAPRALVHRSTVSHWTLSSRMRVTTYPSDRYVGLSWPNHLTDSFLCSGHWFHWLVRSSRTLISLFLTKLQVRPPFFMTEVYIVLISSLASVDYETDRNIQDTIAREFRDRTILCIAHRLRTIIGYDRICVLDAGQIAVCILPAPAFFGRSLPFRSSTAPPLCSRNRMASSGACASARVSRSKISNWPRRAASVTSFHERSALHSDDHWRGQWRTLDYLLD